MKFSSFGGGKEKVYPIEPDRSKNFELDPKVFSEFIPKEEFTRVPFNPNVRPNLPDLPSADLTRKHLYGYADPGEPQSCYVAVNHNG